MSSLKLIRNGNLSTVVDGQVPLLKFSSGDLFYGGSFMIQDARLHPNHPIRLTHLKPSWNSLVPRLTPSKVHIVDEPTPHGLRLHLVPKAQGPVEIQDTYEFLPDPDHGGWMIDHHFHATFRRDTLARELGFYLFLDPHGTPAYAWDFDDPLPTHGVGPGVPMQEDWMGVLEPHVGPDTFRKHWKQEVESFIHQEPSGRIRTARTHRGMLSALTQANRRAVPHKPGGFSGFVYTDGSGVLFEQQDNQPYSGHYCEWGFDFHFTRLLPGHPDTLILKKGRVLKAHYLIREVPPDAMKPILKKAVPIEPAAPEWKRSDALPIYEDPVNHFNTSWKHDRAANSYPWIPGFGATWDRKVGRKKPGSLKLVNSNTGGHDPECVHWATWKSPLVGTSTWMNPLVPNARYRFSGFVRVKLPSPNFYFSSPQLTITFHKYAGPGTFSPEIRPAPVFYGNFKAAKHHAAMGWDPQTWYPIEVISGPIDGNVMTVTLGCHFSGEGEAWFDELSFQKIE